jgi:hypothetical protein
MKAWYGRRFAVVTVGLGMAADAIGPAAFHVGVVWRCPDQRFGRNTSSQS